ncbi:hypothetical protein RhiirA5_416066 [Rhizophagus irregularis]|uniref:Uncharacterized protein n=2 Tax=Rhizophagus irregularis TaxID=588596 RepID=A0A2N0SGV9_9GLOM|nr:hypothetical protein GLOIN_2v1790673 [Rhizophagus irregularis DAOM 181602=DAOM 197198]PKC09136.1 hypothetical protein RhiirA5_416066 [Rhizophagus irregularis]PKC74766.1 hypothetical protein RhiirA1_449620 [Rhizophagus irregularis]POG58234.1 hypothetical protein GLOIN_2v1790673 [Rhizophagus irregularis DAOM 181602=DAOM 197198]CAB4490759.1 unnamed protein product [Rhizophagus irregularis]CAB5192556.1 unnamed protein product [Rhizophagus irregularis]|eukprot:XP_025165100.1 hypothetical protein GLOIN_2v1790673 [Rhizophagus irregularis DAOM 181602=DAOM 197198]
MFLITEGDGANSYEGIDLSNPDICKHVLCVQGELKTASHHNGNVFWKMIKWYQQIGNLHIVAFITYGYKDVWDHTSATRTIDVSPFVVPRENIWSIKDVHFTKDEYEDYFLCFCKK